MEDNNSLFFFYEFRGRDMDNHLLTNDGSKDVHGILSEKWALSKIKNDLYYCDTNYHPPDLWC